MVSQFVSVEDVRLLSHLDYKFPDGTITVGRLDSLSEGLLLLTTNTKVVHLLFQSAIPHKRTYLVRVNKLVSPQTVQQLSEGVTIRVRGKGDYTTQPCEVRLLDAPPDLPDYQLELNPYIAHSWLHITLYEGKFHQIRNMVAAVGHQCRRLIRIAIEDITLEDLTPGGVREIEEAQFFRLLKIGEPEV